MKPLCWLHAAIFSAGLLLTGPAALAQDTPAPAASAATDNADSIAVVIGNGTYQGGTMPAPYAENDADAMQDWLVHGLGFTPDNIILEKNATLDTFNRIFGTADHPEAGELSSRVRPSRSNVFVFYSGHGAPDVSDKTAGDKPAYLIPVDVAPAEAKNGYSEETLMRNLEAVRQQIGRDHWLVAMLETSFSGETPRGSLLGPSERLSFTPKAYDPKASVIKVLAARNNQVANWDEKAKLGLMTSRFLLAAAGEGGQTPEGMVPWSGIATYVTGEVTRLSRTENAHGQDAAIDPAPIAAKPYVVPQIAPELGGIRDQAAWDAAQKADTRQAYADYAAQCAGIVTAPCAFKSQAEARIGQIEHAAAVAQDQTLWDAAQKADTRQAYADYLAQCATVATAPCAYKSQAEARGQAIAHAEQVAQDQKLWDAIFVSKDYGTYLAECTRAKTGCLHKAEIPDCGKLFATADSAGTIEAYDTYLKACRKDRFAATAVAILQKLRQKPTATPVVQEVKASACAQPKGPLSRLYCHAIAH